MSTIHQVAFVDHLRCVGCQLCVDCCAEVVDAIRLRPIWASVDADPCIGCLRCIPVCPTGAIGAVVGPCIAGL
ncbi:MAG: DUF362 domain-containing protein [Acidimicrobiales bacterium]